MKRRFFVQKVSLLFFLAFLLTFVPFCAASAQSYDLSVTATPLKLVSPGELVTHVFTVKNEGTASDVYDLQLDLPQGWNSLPVPSQLSLASGASKPVFVNVNVPQNARAGKYGVKLTAQSTGDAVQASATTHIQVRSAPSFELSWAVEPSRVGPGSTAEGKIRLTNTGNLVDRYKISVTVEENWEYSLQQEELQLMPGQSNSLIFSFTVPEGAGASERYRVEIEVNSVRQQDLEKTLTTTGRLGPPPPEKVGGTLFPTWDTTLDMFVNQKGDPKFFFAGRGDLPRVGEVSANLKFDMEGVEGASLRLMKEGWGFVLDSASISGSYLGVSGSPLFIGEIGNSRTKLLFTEEKKGLSIAQDGDNWETRGILATDGEENFYFAELQGVYEFETGQVLDGLITTAETQTESGTIIEGGLELSDEKFEIYPSFVKVFSGYPNQAPRQGVSVDINWEEDQFTSFFNWNYTRTQLGEIPHTYYNVENNFQASTSIDLGEDLDSNFSLGLTRRISDDDPASNDLVSRFFSGSLNGEGFLPWSLGASFTETKDRVSNTRTYVETIDASIDFQLGETDHSASTSFRRTVGPSDTTYSNTFTLTSDFPDFPLSPRFSLNRGSDDTTMRVGISEVSLRDVAVSFSLSASLVQQDSVSASFTASFPAPFPFCGPTKGQVTGYLFIDENGNGKRDEGEEGIPQALLRLNGQEALSGEKGNFAFPPLPAGSYELEIVDIKAGLKPTVEMPHPVELEAGQKPEIAVPLRPRSWVRGLVFRDKNQNGIQEKEEAGVSGITFSITGEEMEKEIKSSSNGRFVADLTPGSYQITLQEESLPERYEPTTSKTVAVTAKRYGRTEVEFGIHQKPKPVVITFGPPTASFSYSPAEPQAGEEILLDGSDSTAIQTEIETYRWKLTHGESVIEKEGKEVKVALEESGEWEVSLTVVDKNGLKGKEVKKISVS